MAPVAVTIRSIFQTKVSRVSNDKHDFIVEVMLDCQSSNEMLIEGLSDRSGGRNPFHTDFETTRLRKSHA